MTLNKLECDGCINLFSNFIHSILSESDFSENIVNTWKEALDKFVKPSENQEQTLIRLGVEALSLLIQTEWTGPALEDQTIDSVKKLASNIRRDQIISFLIVDGDDLSPILHPQLLLFALTVFEYVHQLNANSKMANRWLLRVLFIQQVLLDEKSPKIYERLEKILEKLDQLTDKNDEVEFRLEAARIRLFYGYVDKAELEIQKASKEAGFQFRFTGAMGKRTHYQGHDLAQLLMKVDVTKANGASEPTSARPKKVLLQDDVRMERIKFTDPGDDKEESLPSQHVSILLALLMLRRKALPEDELSLEESKTMVERLLNGQGTWAVQLSALLLRSHLERASRRTVERAMLQVQAVLDEMQEQTRPAEERIHDFFVSHLPTRREVELILAESQLALGAIKSALDICLRLQQWELSIVCYNALQLRHKAKELIEQELAKEETPKLWCLLGDATDDVACYEKAWKLSGERSCRAQRHWANYHYIRKQYGESIEHLEKSLEINSLQCDLWFRLGFAALHEEKWELSAKAYRRYCTLEHDSFEAWNNLARCYCELNQKDRAWRALKEALKVDDRNWKVWDNYMRVSASLKHHSEVIRSYNQLLEIKKTTHVDMDVVMSLIHGYFTNEDNDSRCQLRSQLLDLLTRLADSPNQHDTALWMLCADICERCDEEKEKDYLLKAHTSAVNHGNWHAELASCKRVIAILERLSEFAEKDSKTRNFFLLVAKPSLGAISRSHPDANLCSSLQDKIASWTSHSN